MNEAYKQQKKIETVSDINEQCCFAFDSIIIV